MNIREVFRNITGARAIPTQRDAPAPEQRKTRLFLPSDTRYALTYGEALLTSREIANLFSSGHSDLGFYLAMKAASSNDDLQRQLLTRVAQLDFDPSKLIADDASTILNQLRQREIESNEVTALEQRRATGVQAGKLGEVSRAGFEPWSESFDPVLEKVFGETPDAELYVVANAPYIALRIIAKHTIDADRPLNIIRPDRFSDPTKPVGWRIKPTDSDISIEEIPHNFQRPLTAVILDDAEKTGAKKTDSIEFWIQGGRYQQPQYAVTRIISQSF